VNERVLTGKARRARRLGGIVSSEIGATERVKAVSPPRVGAESSRILGRGEMNSRISTAEVAEIAEIRRENLVGAGRTHERNERVLTGKARRARRLGGIVSSEIGATGRVKAVSPPRVGAGSSRILGRGGNESKNFYHGTRRNR
jgi:hypothetical protein